MVANRQIPGVAIARSSQLGLPRTKLPVNRPVARLGGIQRLRQFPSPLISLLLPLPATTFLPSQHKHKSTLHSKTLDTEAFDKPRSIDITTTSNSSGSLRQTSLCQLSKTSKLLVSEPLSQPLSPTPRTTPTKGVTQCLEHTGMPVQ